jgi:hypothetical protein
MNGFIEHVYVHSQLVTTFYRSLTDASVLSLLQSPLAVSWQRIFNTGAITVLLNYALQILNIKS